MEKLREEDHSSKIAPEGYSVDYAGREYHSDTRYAIRFKGRGIDGSVGVTFGREVATWQDGHAHEHTSEIFHVHEGWIGMVFEPAPGEYRHLIVRSRQQCIAVPAMGPHAVLVSGSAVFTVIKYGDGTKGRDWKDAPELTAYVRGLSEQDFIELAEPVTGGMM